MNAIWHDRSYTAEKREDGIYVASPCRSAVVQDEAEALRWLCCMSLRKGKARLLLKLVKRSELTKQVIRL